MTLRRGIPGQSGTQWFFTEAGRPFSFYAVLGSHALRPALVPRVNTLLTSLDAEPGRRRRPRREAAVELIGLYLVAAGPPRRRRRRQGGPTRRHGPRHGRAAAGPPPLARWCAGRAGRRAGGGRARRRRPRRSRARSPRPSSRSPTPASSASWPTPAGAAARSPPAAASAAPTRRPPRSTWSSTSCWPSPQRPSPPAHPAHGTLVTQLAHQPWAGFPLLFVSAVGLWLTALALSALAALDRGPPPGAPGRHRSS